ncbi:hypothetical protein PF001_g30302, partial [Phytophthora fragariae]
GVGVAFAVLGQATNFGVFAALGPNEDLFGPEHRGKIMALEFAAFSAGGALFAELYKHYFDGHVPLYFGCLMFAVFLLAWVTLYRPGKEDPARAVAAAPPIHALDEFMPPDTKTRTSVDLERNCKLHVVPTAQPDITGREILADSRFWLLFATVFILVGSSLFIMSNIAFIVESLGGPMEQIPGIEAIFDKKQYNHQCKFDFTMLTLYLARKKEGGGTKWLTDDRHVKNFLRGGISTEYEEMRPTWTLDDEAYFGANFQPRPKQVHVLVELPDLPNKRLRVEIGPRIEMFEGVPQIKIQGVQYVTLPAAFLDKCGYKVSDDVMLYCRREVHDLWGFVQNEVIAKNARGFIVGPPGTGKSVSTLSFVASLDHQEWNVVWIHLGKNLDSCLALGTKEYWEITELSSFELPRVAGKKLFICLDGFRATTAHDDFFQRVFALLD